MNFQLEYKQWEKFQQWATILGLWVKDIKKRPQILQDIAHALDYPPEFDDCPLHPTAIDTT